MPRRDDPPGLVNAFRVVGARRQTGVTPGTAGSIEACADDFTLPPALAH